MSADRHSRARESRSTAEQELLSSTSSDVCELWSGQEIVRLIGNPQGMKTLICADDGKVFDLHSAFGAGYLRLTGRGGLKGTQEEEVIVSLNNAAPNLALNVKNATAPAWELWIWAVVGVLLQAAALTVPGLATYRKLAPPPPRLHSSPPMRSNSSLGWNWEKAGSPIAVYGYPCFLAGTALVIAGTMGWFVTVPSFQPCVC